MLPQRSYGILHRSDLLIKLNFALFCNLMRLFKCLTMGWLPMILSSSRDGISFVSYRDEMLKAQ